MPDIEIDVEYSGVISYASTHNGRPIVQRLSLRTTDGAVYSGVDVSLSVDSLGTAVSERWMRAVAAVGATATTWDSVELRLDANTLYQLTDQRPASLTVRVARGEEELAVKRFDLTLLAANAWVWESPIDDFGLMLPAFVMPNHPSLRPILDDASRRLAAAGLNSGLSGYQGDAAQVAGIAAAIYESVRALGITYVDPPASWDMMSNPSTFGQRIRTPGEVIAERAGTCIDTAVLIASLLENVGLNPILTLVPKHALVGYWRTDADDSSFPASIWPIKSAMNLVDDGHIALFETTTVCGGPDSEPFAVAVNEGRRRVVEYGALEASTESQSRFIDVVPARRRNRVFPIPAKITRDDGTVEVVEYKPQEFSINLLQAALAAEGGSTKAGLASNVAPARVRKWKNSLLDLSLRNPLINYRSPMGSSVGLLVPRGSLGTIEDLLQSDHEVSLLPLSNQMSELNLGNRVEVSQQVDTQLATLLTTERALVTNAQDDAYLTRLRRIASLAKGVKEDTGNNNLFLALGTLVWTPEGKGEVRSPLILVPVNLKSYNRSKSFKLEIDQTGAVTPNYSLAEKLLQDANFKLPKLIEPDLDDAGVDIDGLLAYVREEITKAQLAGFRVDETCTLGFFDFSTYRLWRDLSDNWPTFMKAPLVNHLVNTPQLEFTDAAADNAEDDAADLDELAALLPVSTDGSQVTAVSKAMAGKTFVLQGPPGTGKSQTITNLLARALHSGKRVLFIAEKPPALDVVKDRLESVGLAPFILNLHSKSLKPAAVRQQLLAVLDAAVSPDRDGYDAAFSELNRALPALQRYPERIHARGKFAESAYSARNKLLAQTQVVALPVPGSSLTAFDLATKNQITAALRDAAGAGATAGTAADNPWSLATVAGSELAGEVVTAIASLVATVFTENTAALRTDSGRAFLAGIESIQEVTYLAGLQGHVVPTVPTIDAASTAEQKSARTALLAALARLDSDPYPASVGPQAMAAPVQQLAAAIETARHSFFIGRRKRIEAVCRQLEMFLVPCSTIAVGQFDAMLATIAAAQAEASTAVSLATSMVSLAVPQGWNPLDAAQRPAISNEVKWIDYWVALLEPLESAGRQRVRALVGSAGVDLPSLARLGSALRDLLAMITPTESSIALWRAGRSLADAWATSVELWQRDATERGLIRLVRWAAIHDLLEPLASAGLDDARRMILSGKIAYADADPAFERGFLEAVFSRQLDDEGLDTFDGPAHDRSVSSFTRSGASIRGAIPGILGSDLIATRGFDSGVTIGAVGELKRELGRTRGGKSIRKLLIDHWNVISRLTPCVLASPDSVVRFVDADLEPFDLVVFDEASQIRVPHAIGALGRAKAAVIVGDSKQMPPTSIAEISGASEEEDDQLEDGVVIDEESILSESVQARVPDVMLAWHYRSEDESLIAFSNQQYYDGRLSTFPAASNTLSDKGLSFVRIEGTFNRTALPRDRFRTNAEEADAIVAEIVRRLHDPVLRRYSIGVVTFNKPQQELITALLTALGDGLVDDAMQADTGEGLLIRNLEDVQGQERDVVLFSVAFSKNGGPTLPLNFGPLNRAGGERRLNVAVTRARRQVIVFCSFEPSDLRVEGSTSIGLRHLRTYLELAKFGPESSGAVSSQAVRPPDRHRDDILGALRAADLECQPDIGLSDFKVDIAILDPNDRTKRLVGILLDGATWNSRVTVGDRDSLPADLLTHKMNWPAIERIWMPTWMRDRQGEIERIVTAVAEARERLAREALEPAEASAAPLYPTTISAPTTNGDSRSRADSASSFASSSLSGASERFAAQPRAAAQPAVAAAAWPNIPAWQSWPVRIIGDVSYLDQLRSHIVTNGINEIANEIVLREGPISPSRFTRLIGLAHDLQRVSAKRAEELLTVRTSLVKDEEGFYFHADSGPDRFSEWQKSEPGSGRGIADISLSELSNAMRDIARLGLGVSREDLPRLTAQVFGTSRVTVGIRDRLDSALAYGVRRGTLLERGEYVQPAASPRTAS